MTNENEKKKADSASQVFTDAENKIVDEKMNAYGETYGKPVSEDFKFNKEYVYNFLRFPGTKQSLFGGILGGTLGGMYGFRKHRNIVKMMDWAVGGFIVSYLVTWTTYRYLYFSEQEVVRSGIAAQSSKVLTAKATDPTWKDKLDAAKAQKLAEAKNGNNNNNNNQK